jgi:drug/metabolite transporter (DMT)-like permease
MAIYINYALLVQFFILSLAWYFSGDRVQGLYWLGAFLCTAGVTFR